jgi:transposase
MEVPPLMLAELVQHVIGVDPDRDWITLAIIDARTTGICAHGRFPATARGYVDAAQFVDGHSIDTERAWAIEGTASYGRGLTVALSRRGEWVIEFDRPTRLTNDGAKSDHLDAVRAAREVLGRDRLSAPRAHDGAREAIRVHAVTRAAAVRARTGAINELKALIVAADESLRAQLRGLRTAEQVERCSRFRDRGVDDDNVERRCTRLALRVSPAGSITSTARSPTTTENSRLCCDTPRRSSSQNAASATSRRLSSTSLGPIPDAAEAKLPSARLAGTSPIAATSGQNQTRHRLNRGGDRQLNCALHQVAITKRRYDPATKAYIARRTSEDISERCATRCIKRFLARRIWRLLEHPPITP